jgi:hypothetical protein
MIVLSRAFDKAPIGGGGLGKVMIGSTFKIQISNKKLIKR